MALANFTPTDTAPKHPTDPTNPPAPPAPVKPPVLAIRAWPDPVIDVHGFHPRADYVENFWLGVLGPSAVWLMRLLVSGLDDSPGGYDLDLNDAARTLGLGLGDPTPGRHSPFMRTVHRTIKFEMARLDPDGTLAVRRRMPPLSARHVQRLPVTLQATHARWQASLLQVAPDDHVRRRARRLALSLLELGESRDETERQLQRWRFHPAIAYDATIWAAVRRADRATEPAAS